MIKNWYSLFSENMKDFEGYSIGKIFKYLNNPEIISLAGGLPSPDMFLKDEMRTISKKLLDEDLEKIFQYTSVPGEKNLIDAIIYFLEKDNINVRDENILITSSGQHGLDIVGRLFLNPEDTIIIDRPTFAGAIVAFQMQCPKIVGVDIQEDGPDVEAYRQKIEQLKKQDI